MDMGIKYENMDMTIVPGDDFFDYATLGWRRAHPIPDDYTRYDAIEILRETNLKRVREIAENDTGKIGTLYKIAMDEQKLNDDGIKPVLKYFAEIDAIKNKSELPEYLGKNHAFFSSFWGDAVALDEQDSDHFLYNIVQGGTGLSRDYYFDDDAQTKNIRKKYIEFIAAQLKNFGVNADAKKIYALEERMAKSFFTKEVLRDPHANYHKMSRKDFIAEYRGFDWEKYFDARGTNAAEYLNIAQPSAIKESIKIINDTDLDLIKDYLKYCVILAADGLLDDKTYDISFDFFNRTIAGQKEKKPRWKRAIGILNGTLGEEIGHLYVKKYFPESAKKRMQKLVKNLRRAYTMRIEHVDWMSDTTRARAIEKLDSFNAKIGYPDKWRDYSKLKISDNESLFENMLRVAKFEDNFWLEKIGQENDPTLWYMNAHEINAYYDPSTNEICFPAGILQYPFFDMNADDAFNYGAIGAIIGHEMTHGFDDSGRHFDKDGNMRDWWTDTDANEFEKRASVMRKFFNKIVIAPGINANGEFTLGENLADYGGVTISYTAYKNFGTQSDTIDGLTPDMRFFIAYAGAWAGNLRPEQEIAQTKTNEHSLNRNRVNGILPHIDAWYDAFNIKSENKMYIAPTNRVHLW
ncbi:MAG: M13 family metallopeptidase [Alphaproteobacteria bacterium]|nr:M13 family metallopeptidase [Alphaproteobacteria bacterium]